MMKRYAAAACVLMMAALLAGGCESTANVQAVAPAPSDQLAGIAPESGSYNLYRAVGTDLSKEPMLEKIWTVSLSHGDRIGFRWETMKQEKWAPNGAGFHLIAFAGGQAHDLGPVIDRDTKYVWAGSTGDVMGYFHDQSAKIKNI